MAVMLREIFNLQTIVVLLVSIISTIYISRRVFDIEENKLKVESEKIRLDEAKAAQVVEIKKLEYQMKLNEMARNIDLEKNKRAFDIEENKLKVEAEKIKLEEAKAAQLVELKKLENQIKLDEMTKNMDLEKKKRAFDIEENKLKVEAEKIKLDEAKAAQEVELKKLENQIKLDEMTKNMDLEKNKRCIEMEERKLKIEEEKLKLEEQRMAYTMDLNRIEAEYKLNELNNKEKDVRFKMMVNHHKAFQENIKLCLQQRPEKTVSSGYLVRETTEKVLNPYCQQFVDLLRKSEEVMVRLVGADKANEEIKRIESNKGKSKKS